MVRHLGLFVSVLSLCWVSVFSWEIYAEWVSLNFTWDASHQYSEYISTGKFKPTNCVLAGIKVDKHESVYVTVPRWLDGVPATLNKLIKVGDEYLLSPYPSWNMQAVGVKDNLQNCQSMTIDSKGNMYVIEVGRRNFYDANPANAVAGAPGVWIINTETGVIDTKYYFPPDIAPPNNSFVNDIVIDEVNQVAYLTDAWGTGGLIIYKYKDNTSRRYSGPSTGYNPDYVMIINGVNYGSNQFTTPIDGIALTDDLKAIFYCAVQDTYLYRIPTDILMDFDLTSDEITNSVIQIPGTKPPSDGIVYWDGVLYYGSLTESTYYAVKISSKSLPNLNTDSIPVWPDAVNLRWIDTFSLDWSNPSRLWSVNNALDLFFTGGYDWTGSTGANMRITITTATNMKTSSNDNDDDGEAKSYQIAMIFFVVLSVALLGVIVFLLVRKRSTESSSTKSLL